MCRGHGGLEPTVTGGDIALVGGSDRSDGTLGPCAEAGAFQQRVARDAGALEPSQDRGASAGSGGDQCAGIGVRRGAEKELLQTGDIIVVGIGSASIGRREVVAAGTSSVGVAHGKIKIIAEIHRRIWNGLSDRVWTQHEIPVITDITAAAGFPYI